MDDSSFERIVSSLWIIAAGLGFILNFTQIIWIVRRKKKLVDPFVISLAVVDLQTCCFNIPLEVVELTRGYDWFGSDAGVACGFYWFFRYEGVVCGSIIVCLIGICRYLAVAYPIKTRASCSPMCTNIILAVLTWIISLTLVIPLVVIVPTTSVISATSVNGTDVKVTCVQKQVSRNVVVYGSVIFFLVPTLIMISSHIMLIRILVQRKNNKLLAYKGSNKHFRNSVVNSSLILAYIPLIMPQGIYDISQLLPGGTTLKATTTQEQANIETVLRVISTLIVISNPLVYSFLTPGFIKLADSYAQRLGETLKQHKNLRVIWRSVDWRNRKQQRASLRRFLSDEKLTQKSKHHHHEKHLSISNTNNHPIRSTSETCISSTERSTTRVDVEAVHTNGDIPEPDNPQEKKTLLATRHHPEVITANHPTTSHISTSLQRVPLTVHSLIDLPKMYPDYHYETL